MCSPHLCAAPTWNGFGLDRYRQLPLRFAGGRMGVMVYGPGHVQRWGIIDRRGRVVVAPTWDEVDITERLIYVKRGQKWGVLSPTGRTILPPQYPTRYASTHIDEWNHQMPFTLLQMPDRRWALVTPRGKLLRWRGAVSPVGREVLVVNPKGVRHLYSARTGARLIKQAVHKRSPTCLGRDQARAAVYPVAISTAAGRLRYGLVGLKGPVTKFRYASLGCLQHGLTPFTRRNRSQAPPVRNRQGPKPRKGPLRIPDDEPDQEPGPAEPASR